MHDLVYLCKGGNFQYSNSRLITGVLDAFSASVLMVFNNLDVFPGKGAITYESDGDVRQL